MYCLFAPVRKVLMQVDASLKLVEGSTNFLLVGLDSIGVVLAFLQGCLERIRPGTELDQFDIGGLSDFLYAGHGLFSSNRVLYSLTAAPVKRSVSVSLDRSLAPVHSPVAAARDAGVRERCQGHADNIDKYRHVVALR